jgi:thiol-disulfide isomerase/thioredoxin
MKQIFLLFMLLPILATAQTDTGVQFEHNLNWAAIQAKAKAENKYIFMDCFTTWCGPCRYMSAKIFPQKESGDFMNDKFVSERFSWIQPPKTPTTSKPGTAMAKISRSNMVSTPIPPT